MNKDKVFEKPIVKQFEFDEEVASVFDDMLDRSVPYYKESLDLTINFALKYLEEDDKVCDLGCSTASTLISLAQHSNKKLNLIGIDNSHAMLQRAKRKTNAYGLDIDFICDDIFNVSLDKSKVIISNYTLQFIRPLQREKLIQKIYDSLDDGGIFIFSEKVISNDKVFNKHCIDEYYDFKKTQGYSEFEIAQKREALENVLIPYSEDENKNMIKNAGFKSCDTIFKWVNFATFIAIK
ncbi:MAG: carboxy-S-adenosyl-L-methionine synthase CmoA [Campylobacteraceae bacterium]|jgi:tRNA (cmo5U34)-methyltransferase|nr:carboxy-S-adenosyl-L-methionine synthase CmoA [Campylobacteraceae bacterium]MBT3882558.1 carboxy-S-adenosyl-L-methionine synthase CmoA [Campylobacteraceae bacterium]MBT4030863.1 carboxy-S-adenosyl-L-methionine synthase CmoA [Campylobacteraceae bacterium]MBT4179237.1 carboxy-S-adenosyl-L-methionine synthase CmoA [Campylobacteraceae bacterium]MBT4572481.1 carboxy-S-adenosyl-L-methionine synthase CmoA [Campylobacteraceae bacterium]